MTKEIGTAITCAVKVAFKNGNNLIIGNINCILPTDQEGVISDLYITQSTTSLMIHHGNTEGTLESQNLAVYLGGIVANAFHRDSATTSTSCPFVA